MGGGGLVYWWRWEVPVCALIVGVPAVICAVLVVKKLRGGGGDEVGHGGLWVPCWRRLNPRWLMVYRALAFFSMAWMLYLMLAIDGVFAFYFYTQWTFALVMVYFAIGTIVSAHGCWLSSGKGKAGEGEDESRFLNMENAMRSANARFASKEKASTDSQTCKQARLLGHLLTIIYQICAGAVILTDIVFWCVLVPMQQGKDFKVTLLIGLIHSVNAIFLIIDTALNSLPFQWFGFTYFVCWSASYIIFQWVLHASGLSWWPYPFLELATPWAPLWYLGLAVFHVPCYGIYMILIKAKLSAFPRLFPQEFTTPH